MPKNTAAAETCPGCLGRGAGTDCPVCGLPIPEDLRQHPAPPGVAKLRQRIYRRLDEAAGRSARNGGGLTNRPDET